jgi:hypothetical protein
MPASQPPERWPDMSGYRLIRPKLLEWCIANEIRYREFALCNETGISSHTMRRALQGGTIASGPIHAFMETTGLSFAELFEWVDDDKPPRGMEPPPLRAVGQ